MNSELQKRRLHPLTPWNPLHQARLLYWLCFDPARFIDYRVYHGEAATQRATLWLVSTLVWLPVVIVFLGKAMGLTAPAQHLLLNIAPASYLFGFFDQPSAPSLLDQLFWAIVLLGGPWTGWLAARRHGFAGFAASFIVGIVGFRLIITADSIVALVVGFLAFLLGLGFLRFISERHADAVAEVAMGSWIVIRAIELTRSPSSALNLATFAVATGVTVAIPFVVASILGTSVKRSKASLASRLVLVSLVIAYAGLVWVYWLGG